MGEGQREKDGVCKVKNDRTTARSVYTVFLLFWFNFKSHFPYPPSLDRFLLSSFFLLPLSLFFSFFSFTNHFGFFSTHLNLV